MIQGAVLTCWLVLGVGAQPPILQNPGFETLATTDAPKAWQFVDYGTGSTGRLVQPGAQGTQHCVSITAANTQQRGAWQQKLAFEAGQVLRVRVSYRTALKSGSPGAAVRVTWLRKTAGWDFIGDRTQALAPAADWHSDELVFLAPPKTHAAAVELFNFWGEGTVWFDEVQAAILSDEEKLELLRAQLDRPPSPSQYEYTPEDGMVVGINPPAFVWVPMGALRYAVQWAQDKSFAHPQTVRELELSIFTPGHVLKPGKWWWRYGVEVRDQIAWSKPRQFTIPEDAPELPFELPALVANLPEGHPRLWVRAEELEEWRASVRTNPVFQRVLADADKQAGLDTGSIPEPCAYTEEEKQKSAAWVKHWSEMRNQATAAGHRAWMLGLAYLGTGEDKYAQAGKRWLLHVCSWDPAGTTSLKYNDEAGMPLVYSIPRAYDWLYPALTEEERQRVCEAYAVRGAEAFRVLRNMPFHSNPYSSHPGRWINFLGEGATCFHGEIPEAAEWLSYILQCYRAVYPAWGRDDGGWAEGPNYWKWYILYSFTWMDVARRALGFHVERRPFFRNTGYFKLYSNPPGSGMSPFGDSASESRPDSIDKTIMWHFGELFGEPAFKWFAQQIKGGLSYPLHDLFWSTNKVAAAPPVNLPDARLFPAIGLAAMHSALEDPASDVMVLLKSSPYGSISHSHADQNAFYLQAGGEPLFIDSGWYPWYSSPHHDQWTRETKAHNCVTYDGGQSQAKRLRSANGRITDFATTPAFHYAVGDATPAYQGAVKHFVRRVLFARPDIVFVFDDLTSEKPRRWEWWLHALQPMTVEEAAQAVSAASGTARARCSLVWPQGLSFKQTTGFEPPPENDKADQSHCVATVAQPSAEQFFLAAISVAWGELTPLSATLNRGSNYLAAKVRLGEGEVVATFRTAPGEIRAGRLHADAAVLAARYDAAGKLVASFTDKANAVSNGDSVILASTEPGAYSLRVVGELTIVTAQAARDFELTVRQKECPRRVLLNDREAPAGCWHWEEGKLVLQLTAGDHIVVISPRREIKPPGPTADLPLVVEGQRVAGLKGWRDYESFAAEGRAPGDEPLLARVRVQGRDGRCPDPENLSLRVADMLITRWRASRGDLVSRERIPFPPGASIALRVVGPGAEHRVSGIALEKVLRPTVPIRVEAMPEDGIVVEAEDFVDEGLGRVEVSRGQHADQHGGASLYNNAGDGHWLEWEVDVPTSSDYDLFVRAACDMPYSLRELRVDGELLAQAYSLLRFPNTGGWGHEASEWWAFQVAGGSGEQLPPLRLSAGKHRLRLTGLDSNHLNLDYLVLRPR